MRYTFYFNGKILVSIKLIGSRMTRIYYVKGEEYLRLDFPTLRELDYLLTCFCYSYYGNTLVEVVE